MTDRPDKKKRRDTTPKFQRLMIQVTGAQLDALEEESKRLEISRSELVRRILDEWRDQLK